MITNPEINDTPGKRNAEVELNLRELDDRDPSVIEAAFSKIAGIGVGLFSDYGAAQRMYVSRGYVPDGRGITYHCEAVSGGDKVIADDDLVLWFAKRLD